MDPQSRHWSLDVSSSPVRRRFCLDQVHRELLWPSLNEATIARSSPARAGIQRRTPSTAYGDSLKSNTLGAKPPGNLRLHCSINSGHRPWDRDIRLVLWVTVPPGCSPLIHIHKYTPALPIRKAAAPLHWGCSHARPADKSSFCSSSSRRRWEGRMVLL